MAEEENKETIKTEKPQRKSVSVDGFVSGVGKVFSIGEIPDDPVVKALKRITSWLKYILAIEIVGGLIAFVSCYSFKLIKEGRTDDLAEFLVKAADAAHNEEADAPDETAAPVAKQIICPECGSDDAEIWDTTEDVWVWKCNQCGTEFNAK